MNASTKFSMMSLKFTVKFRTVSIRDVMVSGVEAF